MPTPTQSEITAALRTMQTACLQDLLGNIVLQEATGISAVADILRACAPGRDLTNEVNVEFLHAACVRLTRCVYAEIAKRPEYLPSPDWRDEDAEARRAAIEERIADVVAA